MSAPRKPTLQYKLFRLDCSTLRPLEGKTLDELVATIKGKLIEQGGSPIAEPVLYRNYDWYIRVPAVMTEEEQAQWLVWKDYDDAQKRKRAIASIKKIAAQQGLTVSVGDT